MQSPLKKPTEEKTIEQVLAAFKKDFKEDPFQLLKAINAEDISRFFIDGVHQRGEEGRIYADSASEYDYAVRDYERREQGFYLSSGSAFCFMLDEAKKNNPLSDVELLNFIKKLHEKALEKITVGTNYHSQYCELASHEACYKKHLEQIKEFRASEKIAVNILKPSEEGIKEVLEKIVSGKYPWMQIQVIHFLPSGKEKIIVHDAKTIKSTKEPLPELAHKIFTEIKADEEKSYSSKLKLQLVSVIPGKNVIKQLEEQALQMIKKFRHDIMLSPDPINKIACIVELIHDLEQLHPFNDGNGRTLVTLLLNYLLIKNNLPTVILEDPNNFDLQSKKELLKQVVEGMGNTLALAKDKKLYGQPSLNMNKMTFSLEHAFYQVLNLSRNYFHCTLDEKLCKTKEDEAKKHLENVTLAELKKENADIQRYKKILDNIEQYATKQKWSLGLFHGKKYSLDAKHSVNVPTKIYWQLTHIQEAKKKEKEGKSVDWKHVLEIVIYSGKSYSKESKNTDKKRIDYYSLFKKGNEEKLCAAFGLTEKEDKELVTRELNL